MPQKGDDWTASEESTLQNHWDTHTAQEIADMLPGRTLDAVYSKRQRMKENIGDASREKPVQNQEPELINPWTEDGHHLTDQAKEILARNIDTLAQKKREIPDGRQVEAYLYDDGSIRFSSPMTSSTYTKKPHVKVSSFPDHEIPLSWLEEGEESVEDIPEEEIQRALVESQVDLGWQSWL